MIAKTNNNLNAYTSKKACLVRAYWKGIVLCLLLFFAPLLAKFAGTATAQDFQLSQYDAPPLFLNPAMTGMFDGQSRIHTHYRTQWAAFTNKPFNTTAISIDAPIKKFGVGLQIMNYRAGGGAYNVNSILLSIGYDVVLDAENNHHLAMGMQGGTIQKSIDVDALTFGNQFIGLNGGGFDPSLSSGETFTNSSFLLSDINAGFLYYYAKETSLFNPFFGFSAFHLTQPTETFLGSSNKIPSRIYLHGGSKFNLNGKIQLLPKFIYMRQKNSQSFALSVLLHYFLKESDTYILLGPTYRFNSAAIIEAGIKKGRCLVRVSYDFNTSLIKTAYGSTGGFEISLTYVTRRNKPNPLANCPRL